MDNFLRPYTAEEFEEVFSSSNYNEIAKQYCKEVMDECYGDLIEEYGKDVIKPDWTIDKFKEEPLVEDTLRESAWRYVGECGYVEQYIEQRLQGHSHEWAKVYTNLYSELFSGDRPNKYKLYNMTYRELVSLYKETVIQLWPRENIINNLTASRCGNELLIAIKNIAPHEEDVVHSYLAYKIITPDDLSCGLKELGIEDLLKEAKSFAIYYKNFLSTELGADTPLTHALNLWEEDNSDGQIYIEAYKEALRHNQSYFEADSFARECLSNKINGYILLEESNFKKEFKEEWQHKFYDKLCEEDMKH